MNPRIVTRGNGFEIEKGDVIGGVGLEEMFRSFLGQIFSLNVM